MEDSPIQVFYNGANFFSGENQPVPLYSQTDEFIKYGQNWGVKESLTLNGELIYCDYSGLIELQEKLITHFGKDFQTFEVYEDNQLVFEKPLVKINNISFDESRYVGVLPYTIELECYPSGGFGSLFGVLDPEDSWEFNEEEDQTLSISHTISCKGFNTSSVRNNALDNAKNFVLSKTGWNSSVTPTFICSKKFPDFKPCLTDFSENINRFNGTYSVTETYKSDLYYSGYGILRFTTDLSSGIDSFVTINIQGNVEGCKNSPFENVRSRAVEFDKFAQASLHYYEATNLKDLNPSALESGYNEDSVNKKIEFNASFDNDPRPDVFVNYTTDISSGIESQLYTASINGTVEGRGNLKTRWEKVQNKWKAVNPFYLVNTDYYEFFGGNPPKPLSTTPRSSGVSYNKFDAVISFNLSFDSKINPSGLKDLQESVSFSPSLQKFSSSPYLDLDGEYSILDLGYKNRAEIVVNLNGTLDGTLPFESVKSSLEDRANDIITEYGTTSGIKLLKLQTSSGNNNSISLNASWSFYSPNNIISGTNYGEIATFLVK